MAAETKFKVEYPTDTEYYVHPFAPRFLDYRLYCELLLDKKRGGSKTESMPAYTRDQVVGKNKDGACHFESYAAHLVFFLGGMPRFRRLAKQPQYEWIAPRGAKLVLDDQLWVQYRRRKDKNYVFRKVWLAEDGPTDPSIFIFHCLKVDKDNEASLTHKSNRISAPLVPRSHFEDESVVERERREYLARVQASKGKKAVKRAHARAIRAARERALAAASIASSGSEDATPANSSSGSKAAKASKASKASKSGSKSSGTKSASSAAKKRAAKRAKTPRPVVRKRKRKTDASAASSADLVTEDHAEDLGLQKRRRLIRRRIRRSGPGATDPAASESSDDNLFEPRAASLSVDASHIPQALMDLARSPARASQSSQPTAAPGPPLPSMQERAQALMGKKPAGQVLKVDDQVLSIEVAGPVTCNRTNAVAASLALLADASSQDNSRAAGTIVSKKRPNVLLHQGQHLEMLLDDDAPAPAGFTTASEVMRARVKEKSSMRNRVATRFTSSSQEKPETLSQTLARLTPPPSASPNDAAGGSLPDLELVSSTALPSTSSTASRKKASNLALDSDDDDDAAAAAAAAHSHSVSRCHGDPVPHPANATEPASSSAAAAASASASAQAIAPPDALSDAPPAAPPPPSLVRTTSLADARVPMEWTGTSSPPASLLVRSDSHLGSLNVSQIMNSQQ